MTAIAEPVIVHGIAGGFHLVPIDFEKTIIICPCRGGVTASRHDQQCPFVGRMRLGCYTTNAVTSFVHAPVPAEIRLPGIIP